MLKRHPANPLLTPRDVKPSRGGYVVRGVFNPGAALFNDTIILLARVAEGCEPKAGYISVPYYKFNAGQGTAEILEKPQNDPDLQLKDSRGVVYKSTDYLSTISHVRLAQSRDGIHFKMPDKPFLFPCDASECYGIEDARVSMIDGKYYITYTAVSGDGWAAALALTEDFKTVHRKGIIFPPLTKNVVLFPEKIHKKYYALARPHNIGFGRPSIWISESPDLLHWGNHKCLLRPRNISFEKEKIGPGPPPIKTDRGWLVIYHAKGQDQAYSLFLALLDLNNPTHVLKRSKTPVLYPKLPYEQRGFVPNVVFSNGLVVKPDGGIMLYYGCCDDGIALVQTNIPELLSILKQEA
ncbi:MAG: glycoside hydrolase family 130 protein [Spirochaetales bacterium]|nr:glycoside hydrolase family 130 protein [Spirochaetales bacterium]